MQNLIQCRNLVRDAIYAPEAPLVRQLAALANLSTEDSAAISAHAVTLIEKVRTAKPGLMEEFLGEYGLSTDEGLALMTLAEALLRVPDSQTADALIADKLSPHQWAAHMGKSRSSLVNTSTWALAITGKILKEEESPGLQKTLHAMINRLGEPVVRLATAQAMKIMGGQFVLGQTIQDALEKSRSEIKAGYTYSYDMLGEGALTDKDAAHYFEAYAKAISAIGKSIKGEDIAANPGISVKLSALHPRYQFAKAKLCVPELTQRLLTLCQAAKAHNMGLNVDAEEADRLDMSLDIIEAIMVDESLKGWAGFGVVVQAYGKRASFVIDWLQAAAETYDRQIMVRLVKGAYWDMEIKRAQVMGLSDFPVFTRKEHTDVSYLACARKLLNAPRIYPQFATHNVHTACAVLHMARPDQRFEFQRLHGMGDAQHDLLMKNNKVRSRIYAPVGAHRELLAYLVRRLLENGANSSFINQLNDPDVPAQQIAANPIASVAMTRGLPEPAITMPLDLFQPERSNAIGYDVSDIGEMTRLRQQTSPFMSQTFVAKCVTSANIGHGEPQDVFNPADASEPVGVVVPMAGDLSYGAKAVYDVGYAGYRAWDAQSLKARAEVLKNIAALYERHTPELLAILMREAGKTWADAVGEVREAVDFLTYYAAQGQSISHATEARGVFLCISPWNFPLAIFTGQIAAALMAGNAVVAKPAEQTPVIAHAAVKLMHEAGVPKAALQLILGDGANVGAALVAERRVAGVAFTGSTQTAQTINKVLANNAPDAVLIAETGGLNAMIVDSTSLPEQAVRDILASSFQSAGQRCSALRMLYIQDDVYDTVLTMLKGAASLLTLGKPDDLFTDVGPIIDAPALKNIAAYVKKARDAGTVLFELPVPKSGYFVSPTIISVSGIEELEREIFGPVLHVSRFKAEALQDVVARINATGFGLTCGLHSRIKSRVDEVEARIAVGNFYVNRNQIGAIVGSQPFGGEGLSGTGPKAGGPHYLAKFRRLPSPQSEAVATASVKELETAKIADHLKALNEKSTLVAKSAIASHLSDIWPEQGEFIAQVLRQQKSGTLPGPTGESNELRLLPRGTYLCLGQDDTSLKQQLIMALLTGNKALAISASARSVTKVLSNDLPVLSLDGALNPESLAKLPIAGAAFTGDKKVLRALRTVLAAREGAILPLIQAPDCVADWLHERVTCTDTTAAGGNVSLLAKPSRRPSQAA